MAVGTVLFLLLGIGALGIVGDGDRDWLYLAAPAVLLVVAVATRFRPGGMVLALGAARGDHASSRRRVVAVVPGRRPTRDASRRRRRSTSVVLIAAMYAVPRSRAPAWL